MLALLPIPQGAYRDAESLCELQLRQLRSMAKALDLLAIHEGYGTGFQ